MTTQVVGLRQLTGEPHQIRGHLDVIELVDDLVENRNGALATKPSAG